MASPVGRALHVGGDAVAARALFGGAIVGFVVGVGDGVLSAIPIAQLLPPLGLALTFVYLGATHALVGVALALGVEVLRALLGLTRLGAALSRAVERQRVARAEAPATALAWLSWVVVGLPVTGAVVALTYVAAVADLAERRHAGLVIAVSMVVGVLAVVVGLLAGLVVAGAVERIVGRLVSSPRVLRALGSPALAGVLAALAGLAGIAGVTLFWWDTLAVLSLRPYLVALALATAAFAAARAGRRAASALSALAVWRRLPLYVGWVGALLAAALAAGGYEGVTGAADRYSGLGGRATLAFRSALDLDRDGYSALLGGGDCDDLDPGVHPGAAEIPDDGIDQNCVGGDGRKARASEDTAFVAVPRSVPRDFNVVILTIDTIRADHLGAYGYERATTPTLDRIAANGALFANGWAHAPSTRYSMPAIFTGRYPLAVYYDHGSGGWPAIENRATTIAEILKGRGFFTGGIFNYWYFDKSTRLDQGFDHYDNANKRLHKSSGRRGPEQTKGSSSKEQTDKAIAFLDEHGAERFLLWVHYYDPHYAYERHEGVEDFGSEPMDLYDQEIRFTDDQIGRLVAELEARGLWDETVIVVTGDHGEGFGEHGVKLHGYDLYAAQTKVPFIIRVPGLSPKKISMPVGHVDILPTVANLAGGKPNAQMQGRSLVDVISGARPPDDDRWVYQQLSHGPRHELRAAASLHCHVLYNASPQNTWELYRISEDPKEEREVSQSPGRCVDARPRMEAWYEQSELEHQDTGTFEPASVAGGPLDVRFDGGLRLVGVRLPADPRAPSGSKRVFEVDYEFQSDGKIDAGLKVDARFSVVHGGEFHDLQPLRGDPDAAGRFHVTQKVTIPSTALRGRYVAWVGVRRGRKRLGVGVKSPSLPVEGDRAAVGVVTVQR